jgi:hypothetical protein
LQWTTPADPGGDPGTERYDAYGTQVPDAFGHSTGFCVELDSASSTASDDRVVWPGEVVYYLVRVENDCGTGPIDTDPPPFAPRTLNYLVVDNTSEWGSGSLREAIDLAADGDAICIEATGTIRLSSGVQIDKEIAIAGPGASLLTIEAASALPSLFSLDGESTAFSGVTIDGAGRLAGECVNITDDATINSVTIQDCVTGVYQPSGSDSVVTMRHSLIQGNGRGVMKRGGGAMTIRSSTISGNSIGFELAYYGHYDYSGATISNTILNNTRYNCTWDDYWRFRTDGTNIFSDNSGRSVPRTGTRST